MDYLVWKDQKVNLAYPESKDTQVESEILVNLEPPVKMVLKENPEYLAEMVATDYPASQDSKVNLVHPTLKRVFNDPETSQHTLAIE
jgi:hypothetical protein